MVLNKSVSFPRALCFMCSGIPAPSYFLGDHISYAGCARIPVDFVWEVLAWPLSATVLLCISY